MASKVSLPKIFSYDMIVYCRGPAVFIALTSLVRSGKTEVLKFTLF